ncbi:MAG: GNAT family N-acetyltransferase [Pirellulaceae bacterium]|jgi:RimJ/RimL family protein N-acetyltransferase|nr:GNAT family N-acetyltransferase [Pirellulaceae bacterium]
MILNGGVPPANLRKTLEDAEQWYRSFQGSLRWVIDYGEDLIGTARLDDVDPETMTASFAMGIYLPVHRDRRLGTEAARLIVAHAFGPMGLVELRLRVLYFNSRAIRCYEKSGFTGSGKETSESPDGRSLTDLLMTATPESFTTALEQSHTEHTPQ